MKRLTVSPDDAAAKEDEIHEELGRPFLGLDLKAAPGSGASDIRFHLEQTGRFARSEDGSVFYFRYRTRAWYLVTSKPGSPFSVFVSTLLHLDSRSKATQAALDHLRESLRLRATLMYVELTTDDGETVRAPFKLTKKKHGGFGVKKVRR
jgi:hypothetical protein